MRPEEVRVGNYVLDNGVPSQLIPNDIFAIHDNGSLYSRIPLTENILLKSGLLFKRSFYWIEEIDIALSPLDESAVGYDGCWNVWAYNVEDNSFSFLCLIDSVHELQNLIYILTNEELTISL